MPAVRVTTMVDAPPDVVWADLRRIDTHVEWMHDAVAIRFYDDHREGVGARFACDTRIGPLRLTDRMEITEWVDESVMGVRHVGLVTGDGRFTLEAVEQGRTRFTWEETLRFPWSRGGPVAALLAVPVLRLVWRRNLRTLAARFDR